MCGRIYIPDEAAIERYWNLPRGDRNPFPARCNVAPQQGAPENFIPVIRLNRDKQPILGRLQWWLLPWWSKESRIRYSTFNARVESVSTAPAFRDPFQRRRCLIPVAGWYEWQQTPNGKQPWLFQAAEPGRLLHFAGLWDRWKHEDQLIESCTIVVGEPSKTVADVHDRCPLIIPPEKQLAWLDRELTDPDKVMQLLQPVPEKDLRFYPVSNRVNSAKNDGPDLIDPA